MRKHWAAELPTQALVIFCVMSSNRKNKSCPVHYRILTVILALYLLDASSTHPLRYNQRDSKGWSMSSGGRSHHVRTSATKICLLCSHSHEEATNHSTHCSGSGAGGVGFLWGLECYIQIWGGTLTEGLSQEKTV